MEEKPQTQVPDIDVAQPGPSAAEKALMIRAQKGDKKAFGQLVRQYQKRLLRLVLSMIGDMDPAMDIVQDSFIRAYQSLERFDTERPFYPWLSRIASNLSINYLKRSGREISLDNQLQAAEDSAVDPLARMQIAENDQRFLAALRELPEQYRVVFVLRSIEQMSYDEIARHLDISPGTVDSRLYRARRMLVEKLQDLLE